ncbi:MAG: GNAT family N-acetyltransferase [Bacteroidota bacterium]|nr:GNAT family N-acetyltransferase [Bacteroidota bacterium]
MYINPAIKNGTTAHIAAIYTLYQKVASIKGGLARTKNEITTEYISLFVHKSIQSGIIIIAVDETTSAIVGEIHCYGSGIGVFAQVLGELTIAVDPDYQGKGIGRILFKKLLNTVINEKPEIIRIELIARESNTKAISFYESLGFKKEGRLEKRIQSASGGLEADIPMAWIRKY